MTVLVWAAAVLVMALVAGILGMVLVRGVPHISWNFLTTTASVLKGTDGILPAILNTLYVILLTLLIVLPLGVGAAVYLTEYASNRRLMRGDRVHQRDAGRHPQHPLWSGGHAGVQPGCWASRPACCPAA